MSEQTPNVSSANMRQVVQWLQLQVFLLVLILIAVFVVFLQFDGLPQRVADLVPVDYSGADYGQVSDLQQSVNELSDKVDALQVSVDKLLTSPTAAPGESQSH